MKTLCLLASGVFALVSHTAADVVAPSVPSILITPASVDLNAADAPIAITMRITDDESGVQFGNLFLYNQEGTFVTSLYFDQAQRTSGTALDGNYTMTLIVPRYAAPGTWRVDALVEDVETNRRNIGPTNPDQFAAPTANFTVVNDTVDVAPPILISSSVSPESVNVTNTPGTLTFTIKGGDLTAGFDYGLIYPRDPNGDFQYQLIKYFSVSERISGDGGMVSIRSTLFFQREAWKVTGASISI